MNSEKYISDIYKDFLVNTNQEKKKIIFKIL